MAEGKFTKYPSNIDASTTAETYRIIFVDDWDSRRAEEFLNQQSIWYDWDDWGRMLLHEDGLQLLYDTTIDFKEV